MSQHFVGSDSMTQMWQTCVCRQWLQELSLGLTASEESAPLLDNQLRNGVLLCDLAGVDRFCLPAAMLYLLCRLPIVNSCSLLDVLTQTEISCAELQ